MERVDGKWAVYGLGNQIARHSENYDKSREGVMARLTLTESQPGKWQVIQGRGDRHLDSAHAEGAHHRAAEGRR